MALGGSTAEPALRAEVSAVCPRADVRRVATLALENLPDLRFSRPDLFLQHIDLRTKAADEELAII